MANRSSSSRISHVHVEGFMLVLLIVVVVLSEAMAPSTKVEESFNMQAIHDILFVPEPKDYDHQQFPGVVPRTFAGSLILAGLVAPLVSFTPLSGEDALLVAHAARLTLGMMFVASCVFLGRGLNQVLPQAMGVRVAPPTVTAASTSAAADASRNKKQQTEAEDNNNPSSSSEDEAERQRVIAIASRPTFQFPVVTPCAWFYILVAAVFHIVFYCTRTLPNTFAMVLLTVAYGLLLRGSIEPALAVLGATAAVFRADVLILIAPLGLLLVATGRIGMLRGVLVGAASVAVALATTIPMDSFLWGRWIWPEGSVLFFNTVENQSHLWGTQPWHWYWTYALPRCFLGLLPFLAWASVRVRQTRYLSLSVYAFIGFYSFLPHKEVRFVLIVFPWLLAPLALMLATNARPAPPAAMQNRNSAVARSVKHGQKSTREHIRTATMLAFVLLHVSATVASVWISSFNYPGAEALHNAHAALDAATAGPNRKASNGACAAGRDAPCVVHLDAYAAMTGITRFSKKHFDVMCVLGAAGAVFANQQQCLATTYGEEGGGALPPPCRRGSGASSVVVAYNKNPMWFNGSAPTETQGAAEKAHTFGGGGVADQYEGHQLQRYNNKFDAIVRRREEDFLHTRVGAYENRGTVSSLQRFDFRKMQAVYAPFLTLWQRPAWRRGHEGQEGGRRGATTAHKEKEVGSRSDRGSPATKNKIRQRMM